MEGMVGNLSTPEQVIVLALGIAVLLFGYRIKKIAFFIAWFLLGYIGVTYLMPTITPMLPEVMSTQLFQILIPVCGGLLLALLGFSIEKFCVSAIVFVLTMLIAVQYFGTEMPTLIIAGVIGAVLAGASTMLIKPACILATAGVGAYAVTLAILFLVPDINKAVFYWPMLIGFTVAGAVFQFVTSKKVS